MSTPTAVSDLYYPMPTDAAGLIGLPRLMEMAFRGHDLEPLGQTLIARIERDPRDANALMDLSCLMRLRGQPELAQRMQNEALSITRHFTLPATGVERLRVLSVMTPGALMDNVPIEFLVHGSDVALDMVYLDPSRDTVQLDLPPHDVACISVCESPEARPLLESLSRVIGQLPRPTLNDPARTLLLSRAHLWHVLQGVPGCVVPPSAEVDRTSLQALANGQVPLVGLLPGAGYPIICRPSGSHAGQGLDKLDDAHALARYLAATPGAAADRFVISPFVDYVSGDGQYRKFRIAMVGGRPYPVHLALSTRWMVHYLNGDMADRPDNRAAEQQFFDQFYRAFGQRHARALSHIDERVGLDYYSIDCAELPDGRLLVFEIDTGGVVHAMDPLEGYGYKRPHMLKLFGAFQALLAQAAANPACLKPKLRPMLPERG